MAKPLSVAKFLADYLSSDQTKVPVVNLGLRMVSIKGQWAEVVFTARNEKDEIVYETDPIGLSPGSTVEFKGMPLAIQQLLLEMKLHLEE